MKYTAINLNGTWLKVKKLEFKEAGLDENTYYHDCYITFWNDEVERYDACDVTILEPSDYKEDELTT